MATHIPKIPVLLKIAPQSLSERAKKFEMDMTTDFFKLTVDKQVEALEDETSARHLDLPKIFIHTPFKEVWQLISSRYSDQVAYDSVIGDRSLEKDRKIDLISRLSDKDLYKEFFDEISQKLGGDGHWKAYDYYMPNWFDRICELPTANSIREIRQINTYRAINVLDLGEIIFAVEDQTFEYIVGSHCFEEIGKDDFSSYLEYYCDIDQLKVFKEVGIDEFICYMKDHYNDEHQAKIFERFARLKALIPAKET